MSILSLIGIGTAYAAATPAGTPSTPAAGFLSMLPMLLLIVVVFYFLLVRPQSKRAKEQKELISSLNMGDEIMTSGGIIGRITKLRDNYVALNIGHEVEIILQKNAIVMVLPKGTIDSIK